MPSAAVATAKPSRRRRARGPAVRWPVVDDEDERSLRTTPPMMAEGVDDSVDLRLRTPSSWRYRRETVDRLVALGLEIVPNALQRGLELGLADAEILGQRAELLVTRAAAVEAGLRGRPPEGRDPAAGSAARRAASPRSRRAWPRGRSGRPGRPARASSAERIFASSMPSLAASRLANTSRTSPRWPSRSSFVGPAVAAALRARFDLGPGMPSRGASAFATRRGGRRPLPGRSSRRLSSAARTLPCATPSVLAPSARADAGRRGSRASRGRARIRSRNHPAGRRWRSGPRAPGRRLSGSRAQRRRRRARGRPRGQPPSSWCVGSWQEHRHGS